MAKTSFLALVFLLEALFVEAQSRYMVFFKDKAGTVYSASSPQAFLSQRAINRRLKNKVVISERDFPVNASYVAEVKSKGATALYTTRWFNGVLVECDPSLVSTLQSLAFVAKVELVAPGASTQPKPRANYLSFRPSSNNSPKTVTQLSLIGLDQMHAQNIFGQGVRVAVFDAGFPGVNTVAAFSHLQDNIRDTYNFVNHTANVFVNDDHGTEVLSVMAGYLQNTFTGGAYEAEYYLYQTEDAPSEYRVEEYNWLVAAERADSAGVDVINASVGYNTFDNSAMNYTKAELDGETAVVTQAAQLAVDRGIIVVVSAGNEGANSWRQITPPADAKGVLAAGSVTSARVKSSFSSVGNTSDGRIKPDLCAMGTGTFVVRQSGNTGTANGTSFSSPLLASLVVGLVQKFDTVHSDRIRQALKFTASQAQSPDSLLGYGIPDFTSAAQFLETTTGIETSKPGRFEVYPNPADRDEVYVLSKELGKETTIQVLTVDGQQVKSLSFTPKNEGEKKLVDLSGIAPGLLVFRVSVLNHTEIFRIVKVR
jgi:serine protease AprX